MSIRISPSLKDRVASAAKAVELITDGMTIAMSGYAMAGYPKAIPEELVRRKNSGENLSINLITGANVPWLDEFLGSSEITGSKARLTTPVSPTITKTASPFRSGLAIDFAIISGPIPEGSPIVRKI